MRWKLRAPLRVPQLRGTLSIAGNLSIATSSTFTVPNVTFETGVASTYDLAPHYPGWNGSTMAMYVLSALPANVTFDGAHSLVYDGSGSDVSLGDVLVAVIPLGEP